MAADSAPELEVETLLTCTSLGIDVPEHVTGLDLCLRASRRGARRREHVLEVRVVGRPAVAVVNDDRVAVILLARVDDAAVRHREDGRESEDGRPRRRCEHRTSFCRRSTIVGALPSIAGSGHTGEESLRLNDCEEVRDMVGSLNRFVVSKWNGGLARLSEQVVARTEAMNQARLLVEGIVRIGDPDRHFDGAAVVRESRIVTLGVLATPEAFEATPRLKVACEGVVQTARRRSDVDELVRVGVADEIDTSLAFEIAHPLGIRAALADGPIRERAVARDVRSARIGDVRPTRLHDRFGIDRVGRQDRARSQNGGA